MIEILRNKATVQCTGCREVATFTEDESDTEIKFALTKQGWIFDDYGNQFCMEVCRTLYQKDCEHDEHYKIKTNLATVCQNCGREFGGIIEEHKGE